MAKVLILVNGRWKLSEVDVSSTSTYQESHSPGYVEALTPITLPNSGSYEGSELQVFLNQALQRVGDHYNYVGTGTKTQIAFTSDILETDIITYIVG